ncbi:substrate-binding periplasmic protein [Roseateles sp. LYH14W]|uniref:Substrate-binding periplasmic protein n=1 Tax=Pelomonas parva TaxID=3299032 RepID=A0ABW7F314_9BURK
MGTSKRPLPLAEGSRRRRLLSALGALLWSPHLPLAAQAGPLRVVGSADPPYRSHGPVGASGLYYDLLKEAAQRMGWTLVFIEVPSARALRMMETGEADLMMGPLRTPERERFLSYGQIGLPVEDKVFYTLPGAVPLRSLADLQGRRIAVQRGKRYGGGFDTDMRLQRHEVGDYRAALEMVVRGRVDAAVLPERQGDILLRKSGLGLVKQPWRLPGEVPYLVIARRSPWLARQAELEKAFQAMREDGSWQRILQRYR